MPQQTFTSQPGWQRFNVPKGVDRVTVDLRGGGSGATAGGKVTGQIRVKGTDVLYVLVGEAGEAASGATGGSGGRGGGARGGSASSGRNGGYGGGGASAIRLNSTDGTLKAVAGGAGGRSGDGGAGGRGGGTTGEHGSLGSSGSGQVGNATGGTQAQGGKGGTSSADPGLAGENGANSNLGQAGVGGQQANLTTHGGGGGGGGYRPGGGGAASLIGTAPGGGGGGGSNFTGGLFTGVTSSTGGGGTGNGQVVISWNSPAPADQPPTSPSELKIDGRNESDGLGTKSTGKVDISAVVHDPEKKGVRLVVRYSNSRSFNRVATERSDYTENGKRAHVKLTGLSQETHYYVRVYAQDKHGLMSANYNSTNFWTNRRPSEPELQSPSDNGIILDTDSVTFDWKHVDADPGDSQSAYTLRWRRAAAGAAGNPGPWVSTQASTSFDNYVADPGTFKSGTYYEWTVRTRDEQKAWGPYAATRSFFSLGTVSPPILVSPRSGHAVDISTETTFKWRFRDPTPGESQVKADLRWRVIGTNDWNTRIGDGTIPGADDTWVLPTDTFAAGQHYEWQVRTYHNADPTPSDWSDSEDFWTFASVSILGDSPLIATNLTTLGCGRNRAFIYNRGGTVQIGEVTPLQTISWNSTRDEMGEASFVTNGFGDDCGRLLSTVHTWMHELVVYRDSERVFEGPITLIEDDVDGFSIQAKDVLGYVYRRIMRQGYNDSFHIVNGVEEGLLSVVQRALLLASDALARDDPNVLPYLTAFMFDDDARQSRVVPDYAKTAYEEIDDMAANAGLDYSVIGRRIIFNDTHRPIGRLPELRNEHFDQPPKISEYGMLLASYYASTNNSGLWGAVEHADSPYGLVEILVSSFTEVGAADGETMTKAKADAVRKTLTEQARRGIASRYPAPYIVRVPDSTKLSPDTPVGINQLVPGVWIPLRAKGTVVELAQWQKLDKVQVTESKGLEEVRVTLSPAPNRGQDPDAEGVAEEV
jgi:hypothetical protein